MEKEAKKPQKSPLTAGERVEQGTETAAPTNASGKENQPYTAEQVRELLTHDSFTEDEGARLHFYYLSDAINGTEIEDRIIDADTAGRIWKNTPMGKHFKRCMNFLYAMLDVYSREATFFWRESFRVARRTVLINLSLLAQGGQESTMYDEAHKLFQMCTEDAAAILDLLDGDRETYTQIMQDEDFRFYAEDLVEVTPLRQLEYLISLFYAQAAALDLAAEIFRVPEMRRFIHPYDLLPQCDATIEMYGKARELFYTRFPAANQDLFPAFGKEHFLPRPDSKEVRDARKAGNIASLTVIIASIQKVKLLDMIR